MRKLIILIALLGITNCSERETEVPKGTTREIPNGTLISIRTLVQSIDRLEDEQIISFTEEDQFIEGFVISSDKEGNFFKELIIQDQATNPTAGISVLIDERALYQRYPLGVKVRIRLQGLSIKYKNGAMQLGVIKQGELAAVDFSLIDNHVFRTTIREDLIPLELSLNQVTRAHELLYVLLDSMQFDANLIAPVNKTIAGEISDNFDGLRVMKQCSSDLELVLCTSTFSSFKNVNIPAESGKITGVLTRDFNDDFFVIKANSISDFDFINQERCEPVFFDCPINNTVLETIIFKEDFEEITNEARLEPLGWFNINVTGDEKRWQDKKVTNVDNRTMAISAFNTNLRPLEAWLITPEINLDGVDEAVMRVRVRTRFNNGQALKIWISNSYSGNPLTTHWIQLDLDLPVATSNFKTLEQKISCIGGSVRIAFQYKGFDPVVTSTYEIDDLEVVTR